MKAVMVDKYGSVENMKYTDVEMPSISSNQILIRVKTTSVNFADSFGTTRRERPGILKETAVQVFRLLENGQLDIKISERLPLKDASLAHQFIESRNSTGKVLLYVEN